MRNGLIPKMEWKFGIHAAPSCSEVVLAGANGSFCRIGAVFVGRDELEINLLVIHAFFEWFACFIVETLQFWFASPAD